MPDGHPRRGGTERGSIVVLVVLLTTFTTSWISMGLTRSSTEHRAAAVYRDSIRAVHVAESGLEQVIMNLRTIEASDDLFTGALETGTFTIEQPLTVLEPFVYEAVIHGQSAGVQRSIDAILKVTPLSLFRYALFGDEGVTFGGSARVDSYDSRNGPYDPLTNQNGNGNLGTNSSAVGGITLNGDSYFIDGQLAVGPAVADPATAVVGLQLDQVTAVPPVVTHPEFPLPEVQLPAGVACHDLSLTGSVTMTLPSPGTYCFKNLQVRGGATLTSNGPVTVYLSESLSFEGDSTIGVVNDPSKFLFLMASGTNITMAGSIEGEAELYGAMYGPDATFSIEGFASIYGSVIGNEVQMSGDSRLHYDEALADVDLLSNEGIVEILSWREVQ